MYRDFTDPNWSSGKWRETVLFLFQVPAVDILKEACCLWLLVLLFLLYLFLLLSLLMRDAYFFLKN